MLLSSGSRSEKSTSFSENIPFTKFSISPYIIFNIASVLFLLLFSLKKEEDLIEMPPETAQADKAMVTSFLKEAFLDGNREQASMQHYVEDAVIHIVGVGAGVNDFVTSLTSMVRSI